MLDTWSLDNKIKKNNNDIIEKEVTVDNIKKYLRTSEDIKYKKIYINGDKTISATLVFLEGMVDVDSLNNFVLKPLRQENLVKDVKSQKELVKKILNSGVYFLAQEPITVLKKAISNVLNGNTLLVFDEEKLSICFNAIGYQLRSIGQPVDENVVKGSKDSFVESVKINNTLIRRKLKTYDLRIEQEVVGTFTSTTVSIIYLQNLVDKEMLKELKKRIKDIKVDSIMSASFFEENVKDSKYSLFPQFIYTERPDKACANILDGRIIVIIDGLPFAYIIPVTLAMFFQTPEDYSTNYIVSSFIRLLRYMSFVITIILPALYVAVVTFHQDMIPSPLAEAIIKSKQQVPFTAFTETFFMLIAFEILLEAGMRMPKVIGQTVSIIGGIVIGESAIKANFLSPAVVVVVAMAGICGFLAPNRELSNVVRICRLTLVLLAYALGITGLYIGLTILIYYLSSLTVFGVPYLSPLSGNDQKGIFKDTIFRNPV